MKKAIVTLIVLGSLFFVVGASFADVYVRGYLKRDGTYVRPHWRSDPNGNPFDNWSFPGNINPYTRRRAPGNPGRYLFDYYNRGDLSPGIRIPSPYLPLW